MIECKRLGVALIDQHMQPFPLKFLPFLILINTQKGGGERGGLSSVF